MKTKIIDTHFHIWDVNHLRYPWLDNRGVLNQPFMFEDYEKAMADFDLEGAIFVEVTSTDYKKEALWACDEAKKYDKFKGVIPWCQLEDLKVAEAEMAAYQNNPYIVAVRRMLKKAEDSKLCLDKNFIEGMKLLPKYDLTYDMAVLPTYLDDVYECLKQCPDTKCVLEHCAEPDIKGGGFDYWAPRMTKLAELPNVYLKMSGFVTKADRETWTVDDLRPYMEHVADKFGFDRLMFGSDWPPVSTVTELSNWINIISDVFKGESEANMNQLFNGTAKKFFDL